MHKPRPRLKGMPKSISLLYLVSITEPLISLGLPLHHATAVALLVSSRFASSWFLSHWWCCTCLQFHHAVLYFLWICDWTICISPRGRLKNRSITLEVLAMILNLVPFPSSMQQCDSQSSKTLRGCNFCRRKSPQVCFVLREQQLCFPKTTHSDGAVLIQASSHLYHENPGLG